MVVPADYSSEYVLQKIFGKKKKIICSLASYLGILDDEFEELIAAGKLSTFLSWYNNLGLRVKTHRDHSITWIYFDKAFTPLQWAHLPINHIIGGNT